MYIIVYAQLCTYMHKYYNIIHTVYTLTPAWNLPVSIFYCVLQWFLLVLTSNAASIVSFIWSLNVMSSVVSCADTMTFFDGTCSVFGYRIGLPTRTFTSNIDRMRTALWPNVRFKLLHWFWRYFCSFLWHMNFGFSTPPDLIADILFDGQRQYGRYVFDVCFWCVGLRRSWGL